MAMSHVCRIESSQFDAAAQHFSTSDCESMTPEQRAKLTGLFNQATKVVYKIYLSLLIYQFNV